MIYEKKYKYFCYSFIEKSKRQNYCFVRWRWTNCTTCGNDYDGTRLYQYISTFRR